MKKIAFYVLLLYTGIPCHGTTWTVTNSGFSFSPASLTISIGDEVNFNLGSTHNAREVSMATWNVNGSTALPGFQTPFTGGLVTAAQLGAGVHYYVCSNHASSGMKGTITVQGCAPPSQPPSINGNSSICANSSNSYSISSVAGATSYTWTLPSGWSGSSSTTSITTAANSTGGSISVVANNACGPSQSRSLNISISNGPNQPSSISGNTSVCVNSPNTYSVNSVGGTTSYTWTLPSGWTGNSSTNSISAVTNTNGGTVTVVANNACGTSTARTLNISSLHAPGQPVNISGNTSICANSSNTYTISPVAGATSYTWTVPSGWTGNSSTTSLTTKSNSTGGNISVTANNACGVSSNRTLSISVSSVPGQPLSINGNTSICANTTNTYSITPVVGATSYTWSLPPGWTGSSTTNSITAICNSTGGNISVTANNTCGSSIARSSSVLITNIPNQPLGISGNTSVCANTMNTYTIAAVAGATSYAWILPSGWTGNSTTTSITTVGNTSGGNISVFAINSCGTSLACTLDVLVSHAPNQPSSIIGSQTVCANSSNTFKIDSVAGATSYTWNLPTDWIGNSTTNSITTISNATSGNISVTANNTCGVSVSRILNVSIIDIPAQPVSIIGDTSICVNSANVFSISPADDALSYSWILPAGWLGNSMTDSIQVIADTTGGIISVVAYNMCGISQERILNVVVHSVPSSPSRIIGKDLICSNSLNTYIINTISDASSYTWNLPPGWSGYSNTDSITVMSDTTRGNIMVKANNQCGSSESTVLNIEIQNALPPPLAIIGNELICSSSLNLYKIDSVPGAISYSWTLPQGWTGSSDSSSIIVMSDTSGGNIMVTANNSCGSSDTSILKVFISGIPGSPDSIYGRKSVQAFSSNIYSITPVPGASSYNWTLPIGWTGNSSSDSITVTSDSIGGIIKVAVNNMCGTSDTVSIVVSVSCVPTRPGIISGDIAVCPNSIHTYYIDSVLGSTSYTWTLPSAWIGSSTTDTIIVMTDSLGGIISVTANNDCGTSETSLLNVQVENISNQPAIIEGKSTVCTNSLNLFHASHEGAISFTWTLPDGWSGTSTSDTILVMSDTTGGTITAVANNMCVSSLPGELTIEIAKAPDQPVIINGNTVICAKNNASFNTSPVEGALSYSWTLPEGWSGSSNNDSITIIPDSKSGKVTVTANNMCGSSEAQALDISIDTVDISVSQSGMFLTAQAEEASYQWIDCATKTPIPGQTDKNFVSEMNGSYAVIITQNNCIDTSACYTFNTIGEKVDIAVYHMDIFPNPSHGFFTVETDKKGKGEIEICNFMGEIIHKSILEYPRAEINLDTYPPGIYFAHVYYDHRRVGTKKIILK